MDEMTWTDPQLKARYEENSRKLERLKETLPNLYSEDALPYKVFTTNSIHGIQRMRLIWLKEHHPTGIVRPRHRQRALLGRHQPRLPDHG